MQKLPLALLILPAILLTGGCRPAPPVPPAPPTDPPTPKTNPTSSTAPDTSPLHELAQSHIEGNAPAETDFDKLLKRDLTAYFTKSKGKGTSVTYLFLREGATQSGVSYPKYYLWVSIHRNKKLIETGAVRVAAIDQEYFDITDYLSKSQILKNPKAIDSVFPAPVCIKIRQIIQADN